MKNILKSILGLSLALAFVVPAIAADEVESVKQDAKETAAKAEEMRKEFVTKMERNLGNLEQDISELKGDAATATGEARDKLMKQMGRLEAKRDDMKVELDKATKATGEAWVQMRAGLENAWKEVRNAYKKASDEFKDAKNEAKNKVSN